MATFISDLQHYKNPNESNYSILYLSLALKRPVPDYQRLILVKFKGFWCSFIRKKTAEMLQVCILTMQYYLDGKRDFANRFRKEKFFDMKYNEILLQTFFQFWLYFHCKQNILLYIFRLTVFHAYPLFK